MTCGSAPVSQAVSHFFSWSIMEASAESSFKCEKCKELREIHLHLNELGLFCEYLSNERDVYTRRKGVASKDGTASTKTIAKWLILASQLERVELNPFRYQVSHLYCEPIGDMLDSNARHHESIVTPLTRFMYVSSALEECYRFLSSIYELRYVDLLKSHQKIEYLRNHSAQAAFLLRSIQGRFDVPKHYSHLVDNFLKLIIIYVTTFNTRFDVDLKSPDGIDFGLGLVRNVRNQIAHGSFPVIDDPEYTAEFDRPNIKKNIINLLGQASRLAAINIQILLTLADTKFESDEYEEAAMDHEYGSYFRNNCTVNYLFTLHLQQKFGLNEDVYFQFKSDVNNE
jgi:hypothetical protein